MLTGIIEGGKVNFIKMITLSGLFIFNFQKKCEQYWPDKIGKIFTTETGLQVSLDSVIPFADYNIQSISVRQEVKIVNYLFEQCMYL